MQERTLRRIAAGVSTVLAVDGLLHVYWATGVTWPAHDRVGLSLAVLGVEVPFVPSDLLPLATLLFTGAGIVTARARLGRGHRWGRLLQAGAAAVAAGVLARAVVGLAWACGVGAGLDARAGATFRMLNAAVYTPLCLLMAVGALVVVRSGDTARPAAAAHLEDSLRAR